MDLTASDRLGELFAVITVLLTYPDGLAGHENPVQAARSARRVATTDFDFEEEKAGVLPQIALEQTIFERSRYPFV